MSRVVEREATAVAMLLHTASAWWGGGYVTLMQIVSLSCCLALNIKLCEI